MGNNILIPYSGRIPGGIQDGSDVVIRGRPLFNCSRFSINLCNGPTYDQDCALHFNPRIDDHHVVRNHTQQGEWGREETSGGCPFHRGQAFDIHMKVHHRGYSIKVNNRHFCDFNHRLPKESVQFIYIEGEVAINDIQFRGGHSHASAPAFPGYPPAPSFPAPPAVPGYPPAVPGYPPAVPGYPPAPSYPTGPQAYPGMGGGPIINPPVPFTTAIPGGLFPGKIIFIAGIPHPNPSRFSVNLQCGPYESGDVAFHFDARFNYGNDRNQVIRTHKHNGSYGSEEKDITFFPFNMNVPFEIMILTDPSSFKIAVNNQHFVEFYHRLQPFTRADHVNVTGDVRLTQVRFQ